MRTPIRSNDDAPELALPPAKPTSPLAGLGRRVGIWFLHELYEILPPTIFFIIGFNLVALTTNLILAQYSVAFASFMLVTAAALVVGKAVLVAYTLPFLGHYDRAPLIQPILLKTVVYWAIVFVARLLEHFVRFCLVEHNPVGSFLPHMIATFSWDRFAAIQIWIFVLFLIYVTGSELNHRRRRIAPYPLHPPAVRAAAEPAATDPRTGAVERSRRRAHSR